MKVPFVLISSFYMMKNIISHYASKFSPWGKILLNYLSSKKYWLFIIIAAYCLADIVIISLRSRFLSDETPPNLLTSKQVPKIVTTTEYMPIWDFNIFHNGPIPPPFSPRVTAENNIPTKSLLPLHLNGL